MRVVFDTNIFVSALIFPGGRAEEALTRVIHSEDRLLLSKPILDELLRVLAGKFSRDREELARVAVWLADLAEWVRPERTVRVLKDKADNRIPECAASGNADLIVTGDKGLLEIGSYSGIRILTLHAYLTGRRAGH